MIKAKIVQWIKDKVKEVNATGIVVGLSGGIDSSVVAGLSVEALGKEKVLGLIMPIYSGLKAKEDAILVAKLLEIRYDIVELKDAYDALLKVLPDGDVLVTGNMRPRLRMLSLYYYANKFNLLVAGTGNKSEATMGYFTKYGDGGVDILPIGDLVKYQVRELGRLLNIPEVIVNKVPSADLWEGQTDEGEMGITYTELDNIVYHMSKGHRVNYDKRVYDIVDNAILKTEHKRRMPEICKIS